LLALRQSKHVSTRIFAPKARNGNARGLVFDLSKTKARARCIFGKEQVMMTTPRTLLLVIGLTLVATRPSTNLQMIDNNPPVSSHIPTLVNTCVITNNVERLVKFYEPVLALKAKRPSEDYAEFSTGGGVLAIFSAEAQEKYIPGSTEPAKNRSVILEFRVTDVDQEYRRLQSLVTTWVKPPSTQPWGTRSIYFRDPDGNLVDLYTLAKTQ
jgi:uncharacterized glyoxalase superfamily protein PhnB